MQNQHNGLHTDLELPLQQTYLRGSQSKLNTANSAILPIGIAPTSGVDTEKLAPSRLTHSYVQIPQDSPNAEIRID